MSHHQILRHLLSLGTVALFFLHVLGFIPITFLDRLENITYDMRLRWTLPNRVDQRIVILDLDEKSVNAVGRWPWGRHTVAEMIDTLFDHYQIRIMGFDVVFAEPDTSSGLELMEALGKGALKEDRRFQEQLKKYRPQLQRDRIMAESLRERLVILGYYFKTHVDPGAESTTVGKLPEPVITTEEMGRSNIPFVRAMGYGANLPQLQKSALSAGFFDNPLVDGDGVFRRVPLLQEFQGGIYQSLALGMVRALLGDPPITLGINATAQSPQEIENGLEWVGLGPHHIPVDERGAVLVPFRGRQGSFPYVSAVDVLERQANPEILKGAIVLVGTTSPGLMDLRTTPVQRVYPGVEVHANIISGMLDGTIKHAPAFVTGLELFTMLVIGALMSLMMPRLSPAWGVYLTGILVLVLIWFNAFFWIRIDMVLPIAAILALVLTLFILHMSVGFFVESRGKRRITRQFGQYIPSELVEEMNRSGENFSLGGESREMTVLFSDVRGFTTISEGLSPEELTRLMNAFLTPITRVIHDHRGTIDKYMGDAVMAFWGAPLVDLNHAHNALYASMAMVEAMNELKDEFKARGWPPLKIGIGLNTGIMNVGNMGSEFRMAFTVLGDAVNLGARLEGLTKQYGVDIIAGEETKKAASDIIFRELDRVRVKGKDSAVSIFEPVGYINDVNQESRAELTAYHKAVALYRMRRWIDSQKMFRNLQQRDPERMIYDIYLSRIQHFKSNPPPADWDGVFTHMQK